MEPLEGTFTITGSCKAAKAAREDPKIKASNESYKYVAVIRFNGATKVQLESVLSHKSSVGVRIDNDVRERYLNFPEAKPIPEPLEYDLTEFADKGRIDIPAPIAGKNAVYAMSAKQLEQHKQMIAEYEANKK